MIGGINQMGAPQPCIGAENVFEISTLSDKCLHLSYSLNKLQAISSLSQQQQMSEPNLESENVDMLSDGESYFCVSLLPHQLERIRSLQGTDSNGIAAASTGRFSTLSRRHNREVKALS